MKPIIKLMAITIGAEDLCARAMRGCQATSSAHAIKLTKERTRELIKLAIQSGHESVLEHAVLTYSISNVSRIMTHQLVRHRIASYSQQSARAIDVSEGYVMLPTSIYNSDCREEYIEMSNNILSFYKKMVDVVGIPKEDARYIVPNGILTNIVVTMNARELRHFFKMRLSKDAQWEIRSVAKEMLYIAYSELPNIFKDLWFKYCK